MRVPSPCWRGPLGVEGGSPRVEEVPLPKSRERSPRAASRWRVPDAGGPRDPRLARAFTAGNEEDDRRGAARSRRASRSGGCVLRVLRQRLGRQAGQRRHAGRARPRRHPHGAVDAERLPGAAVGLRDGGAGAGGAARGRRQDAAARGVRARRRARLAAARRVLGAGPVPPADADRGRRGRAQDLRAGGREGRRRVRAEGGARQDRGAVHRRRVPDRGAVGEGLDRPRQLAARQPLPDPRRRRAAAAAVRRVGQQVLRRQGRPQEGQHGRRPRRAVAAAASTTTATTSRCRCASAWRTRRASRT